jgi:hypothetical protein
MLVRLAQAQAEAVLVAVDIQNANAHDILLTDYIPGM